MKKARIAMGMAGLLMATAFLAPRPVSGVFKTVSPDGPYRVGVMIGHVDLDGRAAPAMIWYPAKNAPGTEGHKYHGKLQGSALFDGVPEKKGGPYPLIIFSHGMGGCGNSAIYYVENLASFGYVVVATDHKDSAMCHIEGEPDIGPAKVAAAYIKGGGNLTKTVFILFEDQFEERGIDFSYRPAEASALIDQALAWSRDPGSPFHAMMDPNRIGLTGHSLGGFTTLATGGVPFHCDSPDFNPDECKTDFLVELDIDPCCLALVREMDPFALRDERVKAMLATGPAVIFPDLARAASEIEIPVMIITGSHKKMEVPWEPIWTFYTNAPVPKYLIRVKKSDHMTISDKTLTMGPIIRPFLPGYRSHFKDKAEVYKDYSVAFFDLYLKGDDERAEILNKPSNRFAELWYEAP